MTLAVISNADQGFVLKGNLISNLQCLFEVWDIWKLFFKQGLCNWEIQFILFALISI